MRVVVWFQLFHPVRMTMRTVFALMLVLFRVACVGMFVPMLVFVDMIVFVSVLRPVVGVLMLMRMSVLMFVAVVVLAFHQIPSVFPSGPEPASTTQS